MWTYFWYIFSNDNIRKRHDLYRGQDKRLNTKMTFSRPKRSMDAPMRTCEKISPNKVKV